jgi:hypothetical protein
MSLSKCPFPAYLFGALTASSLLYLYHHLRRKNFRTLSFNHFSAHPYEKELEVALKCAYEAGDNLKAALENDKLIHSKGRANDFVTETDRSNEELIFQKLRKHFPTHKFIGEVSLFCLSRCLSRCDHEIGNQRSKRPS